MIYPGLLLHDRYRVVQLLRRGGLAETWKVDDDGTPKVLKVLIDNYPKAVELFKREAEVLIQLNHRGIPRVEPDGSFTLQLEGKTELLYCLVMEFIEGQNLEEWLNQPVNQPIVQEQAIDWLKQLVEILAKVHEQNYFHRDIKPSNIMVRPDGQLVLIDFGTVRKLTDTYIEKRQRQNVTRIYSFDYTAPEQLRGQACPQSDFFALGRIFIYLLTGKPPEDFEEDSQTFQLHENWRDWAQQISQPLADLIDALIEPSLERRPENARVILQRLAIISLEDPVPSHLQDLSATPKLLAEPIRKLNLPLWQPKTRVPQIGLYGRSGSGKSSLINAIMGKRVAKIDDVKPGTIAPTTYDREQNGWKLTFVDSPTVGESSSEDASQQAINYIVEEGLDVLLFVIPANDRAVGRDYKFLLDLKAAQKIYATELPVILVINKIDLMPPVREWNPPYNLNLNSQSASTPKEAKIRECIQFRIEQYKNLTAGYVPLCALWNDYEDARYNIDELLLKIYDCIPEETKPDFAGSAKLLDPAC